MANSELEFMTYHERWEYEDWLRRIYEERERAWLENGGPEIEFKEYERTRQ